MDKPKTKVVKSKSSNSAITSKSEPRKHHKKSRSNAEFQPPVDRRRGAQKRGVYVEKRHSKMSINETELSPVVIPNHFIGPSSPKPIPRPSKKTFLNSVLNILSQSTTGTQFPDKDDPEKRRSDRTNVKLRRKKEEVIQEDSISSPTSLKKSPQEKEKSFRDKKYRSRVLNETNSDSQQLVVLQSTKEITQTPSNYSEKSHIGKESELVKWTDSLATIKNHNTINTDTVKEKKITFLDSDPSTVIADTPKKDEKKLYNFFVDLLETTFNVYNVKTEVTRPSPSSLNSSKVALEIDETVANKLNIQKINDSTSDDKKLQKTPSKQFYFIKPDDNELWDDQHLLEHFKPAIPNPRRAKTISPTKSIQKKRRMMSESFEYRKAKQIPASTSGSLTPSRKKKTIPKKEKKKSFIKSLKEQLTMEDDAFLEPQNFYQALQMIARNKRRCQKSIHFSNAAPRKSSEGDVHVCKFNRRKLLSSSTKSSNKKSSYYPKTEFIRSIRSFNTRFSDFTTSRKNRTITITETSEKEDSSSDTSLQVFGYDYETKSKKRAEEIDKVLSIHSITRNRDYNMNEALLKYSVSSVMGSHSRFNKVAK